MRHRRSARPATTLPAPKCTKCATVPGDDGLWLDDDQCRAPLVPHTRQPDPEPAVRSGEPQPSRSRSLQHLQLVTQGQHLQLQDDARARTTSAGQQKREEDRHDRRKAYSLIARKINGINKNGLFGRDRTFRRRFSDVQPCITSFGTVHPARSLTPSALPRSRGLQAPAWPCRRR
jgi:hypothetical protein